MPVKTFSGVGICCECVAKVELNSVTKNEVVRCSECGVDLEVVSLDPVLLELAPTQEEDWG